MKRASSVGLCVLLALACIAISLIVYLLATGDKWSSELHHAELTYFVCIAVLCNIGLVCAVGAIVILGLIAQKDPRGNGGNKGLDGESRG